jgi:hypothetical protein
MLDLKIINNLNFKKKIVNNYFFLIILLYLISIKYYFIIENSTTLQSYIVASNTLIFFNAKSFYFLPQSYADWNHPGTPLYYITSMLFFIYKVFSIKEIYEFLKIIHFFIFLFLALSTYTFINYFKKFIEKKYLYLFLILFFSFDTFLYGLETVSYISFYPSLTFLLLIFFHKFIEKSTVKNLIIIIFLIWLSNSLIMSFVSVTVPLSISLFAFIILKKNYNLIKYFIIFNILFIILLNLPILGRVPKIFFNVFFLREETSLDINNFYYLVKNFFIYIINYFHLYFFIFFYFAVKQFNRIKDIKNKSTNVKIYLLTFFLIFLFFILTILMSSSINFLMDPIKLRGIGLHNIYITCVFVFFIFLCNQNLLSSISYKVILISALTIFVFGNYNYIQSRNEKINQLKVKENILHLKINQTIKSYKTLAVFSDLDYGFGDFAILGTGNNVFGGGKFNDELIDAYPNLRYFRMHDIIFKLENKTFQINHYILKIDSFLEKYLPKPLRLIFSPNSLNLTTPWIGSPLRSKEIFISKNETDKLDGIVLNSKLIKSNLPALRELIKTKTNLKNYKQIRVHNDYWHIFY